MADVKWIKIVTDIFDDEKILLIETLPEADSIIVVWFKLLCLAGKQNNSGVFTLNGKIPYTDKMFATIFRRKETVVQLALQTFVNFGMIEIINDTITIPNWGKHQTLDKVEAKAEYMRLYMQGYRQKQIGKVNSKSNSKANVSSAEVELYKEELYKKELDKQEKKKNKPIKLFVEDSIEFQLGEELLNHILENNPNFRKPNLQDWAKHIDLMIRKDHRTPEQIREVIAFCQSDAFWQSNILSTKKLREKYDQLWAKFKGKQPFNMIDGLQKIYNEEVTKSEQD